MFFWAMKNWKPQKMQLPGDATGRGQDWQGLLKMVKIDNGFSLNWRLMWCCCCFFWLDVSGGLVCYGHGLCVFCGHVAFVLQEIQEMMLVRWNFCVYHNSVQNQTYVIRSLIFIYTSHMLMQKIELKRTNRASCLLWTAELEAHVISLQLISSWKQQLLLISKSFCYEKKSVGVIKPCMYMCMSFMFCLLRKNIINMFTKSWMNQK